jgi:hypothetical protein
MAELRLFIEETIDLAKSSYFDAEESIKDSLY